MMLKYVRFLYVAAALIATACVTQGPGIGDPLEPPTGPVPPEGSPQTDAGKILDGELCPKIIDVTWDITYNVTEGLDYYQMKVVTDAYEKQDIYLLRADLSKDLDARAAISSETTPSLWVRQELSKMAADMHASSIPVYAMVNADFCDNRGPVRPRGPVHCDGVIWKSEYSLDSRYPQQGLSYVGVTYDGRMTIGPADEYETVMPFLKECTGAGVILIQDSQIQGGFVTGTQKRDPRTAIGYTSENIVWILVVDGRHGTLGMTYAEMASIFLGLGCEAAVNLDGGGSSEMLVMNPQSGMMQICNWPSDPTDGDGGQERPRPNAWAIVKNKI